MNGVSFLIDETNHKHYMRFDLDKVAKFSLTKLQDLFEMIVATSRKYDEKITIDELGRQLKQEGLLSISL